MTTIQKSFADWRESLPPVRGRYRFDADLSKTNWFQVGGPADVLFKPADRDDLADFLRQKDASVPVTVIGVGSNIIVRDGGIRGVVVKLGREFATCVVEGEVLHAGAACLDVHIAETACEAGLAGLEFLSGIPGTLGGALAMNAGAYGSEIANVVKRIDGVDARGNIHSVDPSQFHYAYRHADVPDGWIFTGAVLKGAAGDPAEIRRRMTQIQTDREASQPIRSKTGGSTFRNPDGHKAWQLIDAAGCRGLREGDAQVSEKHCNFLINHGQATALDLEALGEAVRNRVLDHSGITLDWEIKRIGEQPHRHPVA